MDEYQQMIDDCVKRESRLSQWEQEFIDSVGQRMDRGHSLTEKQSDKLYKIWDQATKNG